MPRKHVSYTKITIMDEERAVVVILGIWVSYSIKWPSHTESISNTFT